MKRSHTDVICEEQYLVVKEEGYHSFPRWDLLVEFSMKIHCFIVVAVPSVTSKHWTCSWYSKQDSFSLML